MNFTNIIILSYLDYPYYVGLSKRIDGITKILAANDVKIQVIAPLARSKSKVINVESNNLQIKRIDLRHLGSGDGVGSKFIQWLIFSIVASFHVIKTCIKTRSIVQYQSIFSAIPALLAKIILNTYVIGDDVVLIRWKINILILKMTDLIFTPSKYAYHFSSMLGKKVYYLPNGVTNSGVLKKKFNYKNILFVGALSFNQNILAVEKIIQLAKKLMQKGLDFNILIVGGPLDSVKHLLNDQVVQNGKVRFLGHISFKQLKNIYSSSSIGVLPFFQDTPLLGGQRTKTLEYFTNGLLVISGSEGIKGIHGLDSERHFLFVNSIEKMAEAIQECRYSPEKYLKIANEGTRYIVLNYSWEKITKHYLNAVKAVLKKKFST